MFDKEKQKLFIGSDHAGFDEKAILHKWLEEKGFNVVDLGCFNADGCDYPDIAREVSEKVLEVEGAFGVLLCGTGIGMAMAANKLKGIRAVDATDESMAVKAREHNDANVLAMGARMLDVAKMKEILGKFVETEFSGEERHQRRVDKVEALRDVK